MRAASLILPLLLVAGCGRSVPSTAPSSAQKTIEETDLEKVKAPVRGFLEAKTFKGQVQFILDPDRFGPIVVKGGDYAPMPNFSDVSAEKPVCHAEDGGWYEVEAIYAATLTTVNSKGRPISTERSQLRRKFTVRKGPDGYRVDWAATFGYKEPANKK